MFHLQSLKDPLPPVISITMIKSTSLGNEKKKKKTASKDPLTQQTTGQ